MAIGCRIAPATHVAADFVYQTTDPTTNAVTGTPNALVDIPAGASQSFVFAFTPTAAFEPTDVQLRFECANALPAATISGLNSLYLSASASHASQRRHRKHPRRHGNGGIFGGNSKRG